MRWFIIIVWMKTCTIGHGSLQTNIVGRWISWTHGVFTRVQMILQSRFSNEQSWFVWIIWCMFEEHKYSTLVEQFVLLQRTLVCKILRGWLTWFRMIGMFVHYMSLVVFRSRLLSCRLEYCDCNTTSTNILFSGNRFSSPKYSWVDDCVCLWSKILCSITNGCLFISFNEYVQMSSNTPS